MDEVCEHLRVAEVPAPNTPEGCEECMQIGARWVHLRLCLRCGHVGCCDSSPNRHARAHAAAVGHPAVKSLERGEEWGYCFTDDIWVEELPGNA